MRRFVLSACLIMVMFAGSAAAQSTLSFAVVVDSPGLSQGIAIINPTSTPASATFTMYSYAGAVLGTSTQTIPAVGQIAKLKSELFAGVNGAWIQVTSATTGLQGFWVGGDFTTAVEGAEAATPRTEQYAPVAGPTVLGVFNPGNSIVSVTIEMYGADGSQLNFISGNQNLPSITRTIQPHAVFDTEIDGFCIGSGCTGSPGLARSLRVTSSAPVVGASMVSPFTGTNIKDVSISNLLPASGVNQLNFPHVVQGVLSPASYSTLIGVTNTSSVTQIVTFTFREEGRAPITLERPIERRGTLQETAASLFGLTGFRNGWVQATGSVSNGSLAGFVAYADLNGGGTTIVPAQQNTALAFFFAHIANLSPWWTGIGLLNPNTGSVSVEVFAMNSDGTLIGGADTVASARLTIPAMTKTAKLLDELIPQTGLRESDGGFVFIRSSVPLIGIELFFLRNGAALANVGANFLPAGLTFIPPLDF